MRLGKIVQANPIQYGSRLVLFFSVICILFFSPSSSLMGDCGCGRRVQHPRLDMHRIESFPQHNIIALEDGSEWSISSDDEANLHLWMPGDPVILGLAPSWFQPVGYVLSNCRCSSTVPVSPFLGPLIHGAHTQWVVGMDRSLHQVSLINGIGARSVWNIDPRDAELFNKWKIEDPVIIGMNDHWSSFFSSYDHILVNVPCCHYVRAEGK